MGEFCQISTELLPLIYVKMVSMLFLGHFLADCLQTLYTSRYMGGVVWDFRWVNFVK